MYEDVRDPAVPGGSESPAGPGEEAAAGEDAGAPPAPAVDYHDRWLRSEAELQNFRRRASREREEVESRAEERVLLELVALLDDLERALAALTPEHRAESWAQGVALTAQRMRDTLARFGVTPIASVGQPFDPAVHEALLEIDAPEGIEPGAVASEVLRGYRRGDRVLRAARVVVAKSGSKG